MPAGQDAYDLGYDIPRIMNLCSWGRGWGGFQPEDFREVEKWELLPTRNNEGVSAT